MSLVTTYFLASDGNLYEATLRGDNWFLCFDDDDPPELVIKGGEGQSNQRAREIAARLLDIVGINADLLTGPHRSGRIFNGKSARSFAFFLDINEPIPVALLPEGSKPAKPRGDYCVELCGGVWKKPKG